MKVVGLIVIVIGTILLLIRGVDFEHNTLAAFGALETNNEQSKKLAWPLYAAGIAIIGGIGLVVADKTSRESV